MQKRVKICCRTAERIESNQPCPASNVVSTPAAAATASSKQTEGFFGGRKNRFRQAMRVLWKAWEYAYAGRKLKKRDFRRLWITRINAACRMNGTTLLAPHARRSRRAASSSTARCSPTWR